MSLTPRRDAVVKRIEVMIGNDASATVVMAVTAETAPQH